ncbi:spore wall protein 2-like [Nilaparvata lugens]|uniref:spore wall protein 2-like n=1 Tax=Nilaparvata lugens TaxID=108931 RepID=UPI00193EAB64|nr:spore wall protein 2-like [Nilaparvata lugens]
MFPEFTRHISKVVSVVVVLVVLVLHTESMFSFHLMTYPFEINDTKGYSRIKRSPNDVSNTDSNTNDATNRGKEQEGGKVEGRDGTVEGDGGVEGSGKGEGIGERKRDRVEKGSGKGEEVRRKREQGKEGGREEEAGEEEEEEGEEGRNNFDRDYSEDPYDAGTADIKYYQENIQKRIRFGLNSLKSRQEEVLQTLLEDPVHDTCKLVNATDNLESQVRDSLVSEVSLFISRVVSQLINKTNDIECILDGAKEAMRIMKLSNPQ